MAKANVNRSTKNLPDTDLTKYDVSDEETGDSDSESESDGVLQNDVEKLSTPKPQHRIQIPDNFVRIGPRQMKKCSDQDSHTELWLMQVPTDFDISKLKNVLDTSALDITGMQTVKVKKEDKKELYRIHTFRDSVDCKKYSLVIADKNKNHILAGNANSGRKCVAYLSPSQEMGRSLQNMMVVTEAFKFPRLTSNNVTMISEKRVSAPTGLKVRFKPFGSGKPWEISEKRHSSKKRKRSSLAEVDDETSFKKRKKKDEVQDECLSPLSSATVSDSALYKVLNKSKKDISPSKIKSPITSTSVDSRNVCESISTPSENVHRHHNTAMVMEETAFSDKNAKIMSPVKHPFTQFKEQHIKHVMKQNVIMPEDKVHTIIKEENFDDDDFLPQSISHNTAHVPRDSMSREIENFSDSTFSSLKLKTPSKRSGFLKDEIFTQKSPSKEKKYCQWNVNADESVNIDKHIFNPPSSSKHKSHKLNITSEAEMSPISIKIENVDELCSTSNSNEKQKKHKHHKKDMTSDIDLSNTADKPLQQEKNISGNILSPRKHKKAKKKKSKNYSHDSYERDLFAIDRIGEK